MHGYSEAHSAREQQDNIDIAKTRKSRSLCELKEADRTNEDRDRERRGECSGLGHGDLPIYLSQTRGLEKLARQRGELLFGERNRIRGGRIVRDGCRSLAVVLQGFVFVA